MKILLLISILICLLGCDNGMSEGIERKVINSDNAIENYEWFKMQEAQIQKMYTQEQIQQQDLNSYLELIGKDSTK